MDDEPINLALPHHAAFDPAAESADAFFAAVPAKWCVALMLDVDGRPLQLVCAKNLRAMLRRRLTAPVATPELPATPTKRVDYRELVRGVRWQRVDGEFEMDLVYIEAARVAFPAHWRRLIPDRAGYFVRIDLDHPHPDFMRESGVDRAGRLFGPFMDKAKADRWADQVRDAFDLCRYRNILAQAPNGRACTYKQMNKCPAPCDGSISLDDYRAGVRGAVEAVSAPARLIERLTADMKRHAADLAFEQAGKVKARLTSLEQLADGAFKSVRPIESFRYVSIQPGGRKGTAKVFLITADAITEVLGVRDASVTAEAVRAVMTGVSTTSSPWPSEVLLGTTCHHLSSAKTSSRFVAADALDATALATMLRSAMKVEATPDESSEAVRETRLVL